MDKKRDEFQELIRNFSLNDAQQPRRAPQPSAQRQQQGQPPFVPPSQGEAAEDLRRSYASPSAGGRQNAPQPGYSQNPRPNPYQQAAVRQNGYAQSARPNVQQPTVRQSGYAQNTRPNPYQQSVQPDAYQQGARQAYAQNPSRQAYPADFRQPAAREERAPQSARERLAQRQSASRFDPAGFQPAAQPVQAGVSASSQGESSRSEPPPSPQREQTAGQPAAFSPRFNPSGFEAAPGANAPRLNAAAQNPSAVARKNFTLHISNPEYQGIPDSPSSGGRTPPPAASRPAPFEEPPAPKKPAQKRRRRRSGRISRFFEALVLVMGAVACAVFLAIFALQSASDMLGMNKPDREAEITIAENATVTEVAEKLKEIGIIEQPLTFELYAKLLKKDNWESGTYEVNTKMAYSQILNSFIRGNTEQETVRIMFPEGQTIMQIAEKLEENRVCSASDFLKAADSGSFDFQFEDQIPHSPLRFHRLEGYIFPDTYDFYIGQNPESVVRRFLEIFNTRVTQDLYDLMDKRGLTLDETITLASIIQKETGNVENMYRVSSVFHNRLASPEAYPRLQSDATTDYVENTIKPNLSSPNQEMFDAYDSYVCEGLPVGPINNPGLDAIKAALDPLETNYYFFLSDQKGEYHFSENINQHNAFLASAGEAHGTAIDHSNEE